MIPRDPKTIKVLLTTVCCVTDGGVSFSMSAIAAPVGFRVLEVEGAATTTLD